MKPSNYWTKFFFVPEKGLLLCIVVLAFWSSSVQARNPKAADYWDISGKWDLGQSNHTTMNLRVVQDDDNTTMIHGRASYSASEGQLEGTLKGDSLSFQIYWKNGDLALYTGKIDSRGMITGTAYVRGHQNNKISWFSSRPMKWSPWPGDTTIIGKGTFPLGTTPPPTRTPAFDKNGLRPGLGNLAHGPNAAPTATAPATPAPPPQAQGAPSIYARPTTVTIPAGQTQGTTVLSWDAGKDHPYAEVWVQVDDQDETKVIEKGKGSLQVKVEPGKTYHYNLSDSGQRLATVTVKTK